MGNLPELCDDIVINIFLRLPVESVCRLRCVSKEWNRFLSSRPFGLKYLSSENRQKNQQTRLFLTPVLGFFQGTPMLSRRDNKAPEFSFLTCLITSEAPSFLHGLGYFMGSSNGLILCGRHPTTYYVCNPVTKQWIQLPEPEPSNNDNHNHHPQGCGCRNGDVDGVAGFLYEADEDTYQVIRADVDPKGRYTNYLPIRTYRSDTTGGAWDCSKLYGCRVFRLIPRFPAQVISRVFFFWLEKTYFYKDGFAAYDPNAKRDRLWLIQLPPQRSKWVSSYILGESCSNGLLQCGLDDYPGFQILTLRKKLRSYSFANPVLASEWIPTLKVPYYLRVPYCPMPAELLTDKIAESQEYPYLLGFHPQSTQHVFMRGGSIVYRYDVETGCITVIPYGGGEASSKMGFFLLPYFSPTWPWCFEGHSFMLDLC